MTGEEVFYGTLAMLALCAWWVVCWIGEKLSWTVEPWQTRLAALADSRPLRDKTEPTTTAERMMVAAWFLDVFDVIWDELSQREGIRRRSAASNKAQRDLRALADWFELHPEQDAEAWRYVERRTS